MTCRFDPHVPFAAEWSAPLWPAPRRSWAPPPSWLMASIDARTAATTAAIVAEHAERRIARTAPLVGDAEIEADRR